MVPYGAPVPLIFHLGGPRHGQVDKVPDRMIVSSLLVYDGPRWIGVYEPLDPPRMHKTSKGRAEVWVVRG